MSGHWRVDSVKLREGGKRGALEAGFLRDLSDMAQKMQKHGLEEGFIIS